MAGCLLSLAPRTASAGYSTIKYNSEPKLDQPGGIIDTLYGLANVVRIDDFGAAIVDELWTVDGTGYGVAKARYAGLLQEWGFFLGESGGTLTPLFTVTSSGYLPSTPSASFTPSGTFRFGLHSYGSGSHPENTWSSRAADNVDLKDHMVTWLIVGNAGAGYSSNPIGSYVVGWEDLPISGSSSSEPDFNDLVIEISNVDPAQCGDGVVQSNEDCDGTACCSEFCTFEPDTAACDDGNACTSDDTCDGAGSCGGDPVTCSDGNVCNGVEACDTLAGCQPGTPLDCVDANLCNGTETCHVTLGCQAGTPLVCNDGLFCNGTETCAPASGCQPGSPPVVSDGVACTADSCDEGTDTIVHAPVDAACSDANLCNGTETCHVTLGCQAGTPLVCNDGLFCNGTETCTPASGCQPGSPPIVSDGVACTADSCDEGTDTIVHAPVDAACSDGLFCNGAETCNVTTGCQPGSPPVVSDGVDCTTDSCDEGTDSIVHAPVDAACDDADECTADSCNPISGCVNDAAGANGNVCTPPDACTALAACQAGLCEPQASVDCDDLNDCTVDSCDLVDGCVNDLIPGCVSACDLVAPTQVPGRIKLLLDDMDEAPGAQGVFVMARSFFPATEDPAVAPHLHGIQMRVRQGNDLVYEVNIPGGLQVPGGEYMSGSTTPVCGNSKEGWQEFVLPNNKRIWRYTNLTGRIPQPGDVEGTCTGDALGVKRIFVTFLNPDVGYKFIVRTKGHALVNPLTSPLDDLGFAFAFGAQVDPLQPSDQATSGQCATADFTDADCRGYVPPGFSLALCNRTQ